MYHSNAGLADMYLFKKKHLVTVTVAQHNRECFLRQNCCLNCILIIEFHYARMTEVSNRCTALCLSIRICLHKKSRPYLNTISRSKARVPIQKCQNGEKNLNLSLTNRFFLFFSIIY